jgi:hypothetical protein
MQKGVSLRGRVSSQYKLSTFSSALLPALVSSSVGIDGPQIIGRHLQINRWSGESPVPRLRRSSPKYACPVPDTGDRERTAICLTLTAAPSENKGLLCDLTLAL